MADMITKAVREDDDQGNPVRYHISYEVEDGADKNQFCVVVEASDMTLATDAAEAKTLANAKAATIKSDWVTAKASAGSTADEPTIEGSVTL